MEDIKPKAYIKCEPSESCDMIESSPDKYTSVPRVRRCRKCGYWVNVNIDRGVVADGEYNCEQCLKIEK